MIKLALPGMVMVMAEWLAFEILTLVASQFGTSYLAAQSILVTVSATTFMVPFPVSIAASTRIANLIGARLVKAAQTAAKVVSLRHNASFMTWFPSANNHTQRLLLPAASLGCSISRCSQASATKFPAYSRRTRR